QRMYFVRLTLQYTLRGLRIFHGTHRIEKPEPVTNREQSFEADINLVFFDQPFFYSIGQGQKRSCATIDIGAMDDRIGTGSCSVGMCFMILIKIIDGPATGRD